MAQEVASRREAGKRDFEGEAWAVVWGEVPGEKMADLLALLRVLGGRPVRRAPWRIQALAQRA
jgi:hypothetical protein